MALTGARRILRQPGHALPYWTLRATSNDPCELSHISLTALARSAQWTGVYARGLDALVRNGVVTIMTGMMAAMRCEAQDLIAILHTSPSINVV